MKPPPNRTVIAGVKKKVAQIEKAIYPTLKDTFFKFEDVIKQIITQDQLYKEGIDGKGKSLGSYAESTKKVKITKKQPIDRVTLKDTGVFYFSIDVIANDTNLVIESYLSYAENLVTRYGIDILSIQEFQMKDFIDIFYKEQMKTEINKIIEK